MRRFLSVVLIAVGAALGGALLMAPDPAHAIFAINSPTDEPDAAPGDGFCRSTIGMGCTLRAAIMEANARPGADQINVPAGTFALKTNGLDDTAAAGDLDITDELTIQGTGLALTVIDGSALTPRDRVFDVRPNVILRLLELRVTGGLPQNAFGGHDGGGIRLLEGATLIGFFLSIDGNEAPSVGGGIAARAGTRITIQGSNIDANAAAVDGGGISVVDGSLTVLLSTISRNVSGRDGGGVRYVGSEFDLWNSTVSSNSASGRGGGLYLASRGSQGFANLHGASFVTLAFNGASGVNGSGAQLFIDAPANAPRWTLARSLLTRGSRGGNCGGQPVESEGFNLEDQNVCRFTAAGDIVNTNPQVGALQLDGGRTKVHPLPSNSPAVDVMPECGFGNDQRGVNRPQDGNRDGVSRCDIGAYELAPR